MEAIRISCAGYPTRKTFDEFVDRFGLLAPETLDGSSDEVSACQRIQEKIGLKGYQRLRREASSLVIQRNVRMHTARKAYKELCSSAISILTGMRGMIARCELCFRKKTSAAIVIQSHCRKYLAQHHFMNLKKAVIATQCARRGKVARQEPRQLKMILVSTSNRALDDLYEGGLQRDPFLPFIATLKGRCVVHEIGSSTDYRKMTSS